MRTEFVTAVGAALAGFFVSFLVCNIFFGEIEPVEVKTIDSEVSTDLGEVSPEIFNYKALNPTVEVYVGNCDGYQDGACVETNSGPGE